MTTDASIDQDLSPNLIAELDAAFADKPSQQQQTADDSQNTSASVESTDNSSDSSGTTSASSDTQPSTKEAILASLTMDEIKAHPELGKQFQSAVDSAAAGMIKGTRASIEREVQLNVARQHFAALSPDELAQELINPEAAKMYGIVVSQTPPPVDPSTAAAVEFYKRELNSIATRLETAGLDETTKSNLNPNLHLLGAGDPQDLLTAYKTKVEDAIIDAKVAKRVGTVTKSDAKADELNRQASDVNNSPDPLVTNGTRRAPAKDFMTTRSDVLLSDAFEEATKTRR